MTDQDRQTAEKKRADEARKRIKEDRETREKATREAAQVKPTPTQEENDLAAMGVHVIDKDEDGSTDPNVPQTKEAKPNASQKGAYQTRETAPAHKS